MSLVVGVLLLVGPCPPFCPVGVWLLPSAEAHLEVHVGSVDEQEDPNGTRTEGTEAGRRPGCRCTERTGTRATSGTEGYLTFETSRTNSGSDPPNSGKAEDVPPRPVFGDEHSNESMRSRPGEGRARR